MERNGKFVQAMLESAKHKGNIEPESKPADLSEVEKLTQEIKRKLQRGE